MRNLNFGRNLLSFFIFVWFTQFHCNSYKLAEEEILFLLLFNEYLESTDGINQMKSVLLSGDRVLICGGSGSRIQADSNCLMFENLYLRKVGGEMLTPRTTNHAMIQLNDGNVLIVGGIQGNTTTANTELFNVNSSQFTMGPKMITSRSRHTLTKLQDGKILVVGGRDSALNWLKSAELYDPIGNTLEVVGDLNLARGRHSAELLSDGRVLIIGGTIGNQNTNTTEFYNPMTKTFSAGPNLNFRRSFFSSTLLAGDQIVIGGGISEEINTQGKYLSSIETYDIGTNTFSVSGQFPEAKGIHMQVKLSATKILFCGGANGNLSPSRIEKRCYLYDSATSNVSELATMIEERVYSTMNLLSTHQVLICGGNNLSKYSNTCELLDLNTNQSRIIVPELY